MLFSEEKPENMQAESLFVCIELSLKGLLLLLPRIVCLQFRFLVQYNLKRTDIPRCSITTSSLLSKGFSTLQSEAAQGCSNAIKKLLRSFKNFSYSI